MSLHAEVLTYEKSHNGHDNINIQMQLYSLRMHEIILLVPNFTDTTSVGKVEITLILL